MKKLLEKQLSSSQPKDGKLKKTILKKLLSVSLVTAMTASLFGCGNTAAGSSTDTGTAEQPAAASTSAQEEVSAEKVPISIYRASFNFATPDSSEVEAIQDAINEYIADKINVEIRLTDLGEGEYPDKTNLALSNGEVDLLWAAS